MLTKYFIAHKLQLAFDPAQPRDETGKWTGTGGASAFRAAQQATPEFKQYFGKSQTVDDNGKPLVLKHGTGRVEISNYDPNKKGNNGLAAGKGFYFAEKDEVANNFAEAQSGSVQPAYAAIENAFDFDALFNVERIIREWPDLPKYFAESVRAHAASKVNDDEHLTGFQIWGHLRDAIGRDAADKNPKVEGLGLRLDKTYWEQIGVQTVNETIERLGYDGIVHSAKDMYGSVRERPDDGRYGNVWVAFKPTQIKSAIANKGGFKKTESNISLALDLAPYFLELDCGTGAGGFKSGNTCAKGDSNDPSGTKANGLREQRGLSGRKGLMAADVWAEYTAKAISKPLANAPGPVNVPGRGKIQFGPVARAREAASAYMATTGRAYNLPTEYVKVDPVRAGKIANEYDRMAHDPQNPEVKAAFKAMIDETLAQYQFIKKTGLKIEAIKPDQKDPYALSPRYAQLDVQENNHLWFFPTASGFGSDEKHDSDNNPLLAPTREKLNGKTLLANDVFRIVHDYFGHFKEGNGFRADGEDNAWRSHSSMYSPLARRAMTTETRGQNSWVNYGPHGESNRSATSDKTHFADQKTGLLSEWVTLELAIGFDEDLHPRGKGGKFTNKAKQAEAKAKEDKLWAEVNDAVKINAEKRAEDLSPSLKAWSKAMDKQHEAHVSDTDKAATFAERYTSTAGFKGFFRESQVVDHDENNKALEVYHGTLRPIAQFNENESNPESFMGAALYFSNTPDDASGNYADKTGPDKANTISRVAEAVQRASEDDPDRVDEDGEPLGAMDDDEAREEAEKIVGTTPNVIPAYLSMQKPVYFGDPIEGVKGPKATMWDYDYESIDPEDEDSEVQPTGKIAEFMTAIRDSIEDFNNGNLVNTQADADQVVQDLQEAFEGGGNVTAEKVMKVAHDSEGLMYADQYDQTTGDSKMYASEIIRDAIERMGYDGLIDRGVWDRWGKHRNVIRRGFQGMTPETIHYVVWHGTQVKSSRGNKGTFDKNTKRLDLSSFFLAFDENQPRDEQGQWAETGAGLATNAASKSQLAKAYPRLTTNTVDGRKTTRDVPNESSVESSLTNYEVMPGIREVSMSQLWDGATMPKPYSVSESKRLNSLVEQIRENKRVTPLIVVIDKDGPYILEGGHRFDALKILGAKSFPARVVIDREGKDTSLSLALKPYFLAFDPSQPRDEQGQWAETGATGAGTKYSAEDAKNLVSKIRSGDSRSKNEGRPSGEPNTGPLVQKRIPLDLFKPDYVQFLRESTSPERIAKYIDAKIDTPIYAMPKRKGDGWQVSDGGHRVIAAIDRGDTTINALVPDKPTGVAAPARVFHGTTAVFDPKDIKMGEDEDYMMDRMIGAHFAEDPEVSNKFTGADIHGGQKEGGNVLPIKLAIKNAKVIDQKFYVDAKKNEYLSKLVKTDQQAIAEDILNETMPDNKEIFVKMVTNLRGVDETEGSEIFDTLKAGKSLPKEKWGVNAFDVTDEYSKERFAPGTSPIAMFVSNFNGQLQGVDMATKQKLVAQYREKLKAKGYDGIRYENTSPNETKGVTNKTAWIAFDRSQIKSSLSLALALRSYFDEFALILAFDESKVSRDDQGQFAEQGATNEHSTEFSQWFGKGQAVKENGAPKVLYHGTANGGWLEFDPDKRDNQALYGPGYYLTEDKSVADTYQEKGAFVDVPELTEEKFFEFEKFVKAQIDAHPNKFGNEVFVEPWKTPLGKPDASFFHVDRKGEQGNPYDKWALGIKSGTMHDYAWLPDPAGLDVLLHRIYGDDRATKKEIVDNTLKHLGAKVPNSETKKVYTNIQNAIDADKKYDSVKLAGHLQEILDDNKLVQKFAADMAGIYGEKSQSYTREYLETQIEYFQRSKELSGGVVVQSIMTNISAKHVPEVLKRMGFDGITHEGGGRQGGGKNMHKVWIAFEPEQIKSVKNIGTFDKKTRRLDLSLALAPYFLAFDESKINRDSQGQFAEKGIAEPGTLPIPEGHVRLYHYTRGKRGEDRPAGMTEDEHGTMLGDRLRKGGIDIGKAIGESYGEPSVVWASAAKPDDGHIYAEFSVARDDSRWGPGFRIDKDADLREWEKYGRDVFFTGSIKPEEILAMHKPWHDKYLYITEAGNEKLREDILAGKHERTMSEPKYGPAIKKFLKENQNV